MYECHNLAAVASNNIWMHFKKRLLSHARRTFALVPDAYKLLAKNEKRQRKLVLMQVADDLARRPSETCKSPPEYHAWLISERALLHIDTAVGDWSSLICRTHLVWLFL
jgi:hypothetical protein